MSYQVDITQEDLHAYCDGQLSPSREREVEQYLKDNPTAARQIEDYLDLNSAIHEIYDPVLEEAIPAQLNINQEQNVTRLLRVAAVFAWFSLGGLVGWYLHLSNDQGSQADPVTMHLVEPASLAHAIYTREDRHPVDVTGEQQEHLVKWLSKRLDIPVRAVNLAKQGYELVGGRLLPSTDRLAAQFMYERSDGIRITMYVRKDAWANKHTAFQFKQEEKMAIFYWIDGPLGYALVGELSKSELLSLSKYIYHQLENQD